MYDGASLTIVRSGCAFSKNDILSQKPMYMVDEMFEESCTERNTRLYVLISYL